MGSTTQQIGNRIRMSCQGMISNLNAMPADKVNWKPLDAGRTALDLTIECAVFAAGTATTLTTRKDPTLDQEAYKRIEEETDTAEKATKLLQDGTEALLAALETFPEEHLTDKITMPWGMVITIGDLLNMIYWNNVYHTGQIAYVQTLYGDKEMHGF